MIDRATRIRRATLSTQAWLHTQPTAYEQSYHDGRRAGWLDASLGQNLNIARTSPIPGYADGYIDGQTAHANGEPL